MAITTLDGAIAGMQNPDPIVKVGIATATGGTGTLRGHTLWYSSGNPGAATANAAGVNGAAVSGAVGGSLLRSNPVSGNAYIGRWAMNASTVGTLWLIDRLWNNSGLSVTSTAAQAISAATLPARDNAGSTNGAGVMAAIEWSATGGAGTPTVTLTYTDQDGNAGNNLIIGGSSTANDTLYGGAGNDTLDALNGGWMFGGPGDDTYIVDNLGDVVVEALNQGTELVQASVSHTLAANVENLTLTGSGFARFDVGYSFSYGSAEYEAMLNGSYALSLTASLWDSFTWDNFTWDGKSLAPIEAELNGTSENIAVVIGCNSAEYQPFTINSFILHYTMLRGLR